MTEVTEGEYRVNITPNKIYIQHALYDRILDIDKTSGNIIETDSNIMENSKTSHLYKPHAILGMIHLENVEFMIFVKSSYFIGKIEKAEIFRVKEVELLPIISDEKLDFLGSDVKNLVDGIKKLYTLGFFYSFNYDLTNSLQNQAKMKCLDILTSANKKFFWNFCLYKNFYLNAENEVINNNINNNNLNINNPFDSNNKTNENNNINYDNYDTNNSSNFNSPSLKVNKIWMVVCIYGYVGVIKNKINSEKTNIYLISRRSIFHSGTRYLTRGVDDNGHVANHVETEQIISCKGQIFSFLQLRGSVPIFFEQPGIKANTNITRGAEMTAPAFRKHIQEIKENFNFIYMINLMNVNKPNEHVITENYELQIKNNEVKNCKYLFWDFQNQCKYDNYENLDYFVSNLESVFKIFKYYHENNEVLTEQNGIIRTNCLDCLDRTNVVQARIAWKMLEIIVRNFLRKFKNLINHKTYSLKELT